MSGKAMISVIVLTYKRFDNIRNNIESILSQTYTNYEIIISDDGSPNIDTDSIYSLFPNEDIPGKVRIITRDHNVGTVKNYNHAVLQAKGDIIVPLSQDDRFYDENVLKMIADSFADDSVNISMGLRKITNRDSFTPNAYQQAILNENSMKKLWFRNACKNMCYGAVLYWKRDFLTKMGLFDESYRLLEDYPMVMKCIEHGVKINVIQFPTIFWDSCGVSGGNKPSPLLLEDQLKLNQCLYEKSKAILNSKTCRDYLGYKASYLDGHGISNLKKYRFIVVDFIIVISKVYSLIKKKELMDCRFDMLWKLELKSSQK